MSTSFRKLQAMLVLTFLLKGGLYQSMFRVLFRRELLMLLVWDSYWSSASKLLFLKASLYIGAAKSKVCLLQDSLLIRLLMDFGSSRSMLGG